MKVLIKKYNIEKQIEDIEIDVSEESIGDAAKYNVWLYYALKAYHANSRLGHPKTKTRSEVSGGGRKPWKQKGLGKARQGSIRAPHWKGGGVVFGPTGRIYEEKINKRFLNKFILHSFLKKSNQICILDVNLNSEKTKNVNNLIDYVCSDLGINFKKKYLFKAYLEDTKSIDNIDNIETFDSGESLLKPFCYDNIVFFTNEFLNIFTKRFALNTGVKL